MCGYRPAFVRANGGFLPLPEVLGPERLVRRRVAASSHRHKTLHPLAVARAPV
jgi:hypothetical protein